MIWINAPGGLRRCHAGMSRDASVDESDILDAAEDCLRRAIDCRDPMLARDLCRLALDYVALLREAKAVAADQTVEPAA